jgi:cellulose synthase/poly-beta-1,6-N-acetylglucosamine synthase-like glycosyltransferase
VLLFGRQGFWLTAERDTLNMPTEPLEWPKVVAVVPARDEANVIARSVSSLVAQDYPGSFRIIVVDDSSTHGTGQIVRALGSHRVEIETGRPLAVLTGKLWGGSHSVELRASPRLPLADGCRHRACARLRRAARRAQPAVSSPCS